MLKEFPNVERAAHCADCEPFGESDGLPILAAYGTGGSEVSVWCEPCRTWHGHGTGQSAAPRPGTDLGHRVAHCLYPDSAYQQKGYFLRYAGPLTTSIKKQHRNARFNHKRAYDSVVNY